MVDSTEQTNGNYAVLEIKDTVVPESAIITISGTTTQTTLPIKLNAKVTHTDNESEIAIASCKYVINTSSSEIGTTASSYTGGTFSSNGENITISSNAMGEWYLHVLSVDNAGNAKETIKGPIIVGANYHTHTGNSSSGGGCYVGKTTRCTGENIVIQAIREGNLSKAYFTTRCNKCGNTIAGQLGTNYAYIGQACGTCGKIIQSGYVLNCGKTETTIESYTITY